MILRGFYYAMSKCLCCGDVCTWHISTFLDDGRFLAIDPGPWTSVGLKFPNNRRQPSKWRTKVKFFLHFSIVFSNFSCMFLNPKKNSNLNSNCSNLLDMKNLQEKLKKHSDTKICSDLSLFEQIVLVISNFLQILGLQPRISKVFLDH